MFVVLRGCCCSRFMCFLFIYSLLFRQAPAWGGVKGDCGVCLFLTRKALGFRHNPGAAQILLLVVGKLRPGFRNGLVLENEIHACEICCRSLLHQNQYQEIKNQQSRSRTRAREHMLHVLLYIFFWGSWFHLCAFATQTMVVVSEYQSSCRRNCIAAQLDRECQPLSLLHVSGNIALPSGS